MGELTKFLNEIACKYADFWQDSICDTPKISIIVPAYNVEKYIEECLSSLLKQTFKDFEVIIINDGSSDLTPDIVNVFQHCDKRFKLISQNNQGLSSARNTGLNNVQSQYVTFVDSDDWVSENYLEGLYSAITKNDCDIAVATIIRKRPKSQKYRVHYTEEKVYETLQEKIDICDIPRCCYVWNKLYKVDLIKDKKFQEGKFFEDVLWIPEIIKASGKLVTVPNIQYYYQVTKGSIVKTTSKKKQNDSYNAKKYIIKFFDENNLTVSQNKRIITKEIKYFLGIPWLRIKEFGNTEIYYLFDFFKLISKKEMLNKRVCHILGLKITTRKKKLSDNEYLTLNMEYEKGNSNTLKVKSKCESLDELLSTDKSIVRYGDGEFNLIFGEDISFQKYNADLANRLMQILKATDENIMVAIPDVFASLEEYNNEAKNFWRKFVVTNRKRIYSILDTDKQYFDACITRPYIDLSDRCEAGDYFKKFKQIWNNKDIIFVEGEVSRLGFNNDLFDNAKSIKRILCPVKNAFDKYEKILQECKKQPKNSIFIIALGPTATLLAYDLAQNGYRALDLGHIDIEYEWFLMGTNKKVPIKNKYVNESKNGKKITKVNDKKYLNEIIFNCSEMVVSNE